METKTLIVRDYTPYSIDKLVENVLLIGILQLYLAIIYIHAMVISTRLKGTQLVQVTQLREESY